VFGAIANVVAYQQETTVLDLFLDEALHGVGYERIVLHPIFDVPACLKEVPNIILEHEIIELCSPIEI
jgi:hypothetical protein